VDEIAAGETSPVWPVYDRQQSCEPSDRLQAQPRFLGQGFWPFNVGRNNFDSIRVNTSATRIRVQAFRRVRYLPHEGQLETNWASSYDFPKVTAGQVVKGGYFRTGHRPTPSGI